MAPATPSEGDPSSRGGRVVVAESGETRRGSTRRRSAHRGGRGRGGRSNGGGGGGGQKKNTASNDTQVLVKFRALLDAGDPRAVEAHRRYEDEHKQLETFLAEARDLLAAPVHQPERRQPEQDKPSPPAKEEEEEEKPVVQQAVVADKVVKPPPGLPPPGLGEPVKPIGPPPGIQARAAAVPKPPPPPPPALKEEVEEETIPEPPPGIRPPGLPRVKEEKKERTLLGGGRLTVRPLEAFTSEADGTIVVRPKAKVEVEWEKEGGDCAIGLFRLGAGTNEASIVTKVPRQAHRSRGRVPFFAPRSAGSFVFRLLAETTSGRYGPSTYASSVPLEVVSTSPAELSESVAQSLVQLRDAKSSKLGALAQLARVAKHAKPEDVDLSTCVDLALDNLEAVLPGPHVVAARRRAGEIDDDENEDAVNKARRGSQSSARRQPRRVDCFRLRWHRIFWTNRRLDERGTGNRLGARCSRSTGTTPKLCSGIETAVGRIGTRRSVPKVAPSQPLRSTSPLEKFCRLSSRPKLSSSSGSRLDSVSKPF